MRFVYIVMKYLKPEYRGVEQKLGRVIGVAATHDLAIKHMRSCEKLFGSDMWTYEIEYTAVIDKE